MSTKLKVYVNEDDALLFWSIPAPIAGCRGFAIERKRTPPNGKKTQGYLPNRTGFENEPVPAKQEEGARPVLKPSTEWPFQRFSWTDHDLETAATVSYRVVPVIRNADKKLAILEAHTSGWSPPKTLGAVGRSRFRPYFNRGFVMSQFMARYLAEKNLTLAEFKKSLENHEEAIRQFLSGDLRKALLGELKKALDEKGDIYAA